MTLTRGATLDASQRATIAAQAAADKKGDDIVVLDVGDIIAITDFLVIASGGNHRHVRTIVDEIEQQVRDAGGGQPRAREGVNDATWVLLDYGDVVVHVFQSETRAYYGLGRLWSDAPRLDTEARVSPTAATASGTAL